MEETGNQTNRTGLLRQQDLKFWWYRPHKEGLVVAIRNGSRTDSEVDCQEKGGEGGEIPELIRSPSWRGVAESPWVLLQPHMETPPGNFGSRSQLLNSTNANAVS